MFGDTWAWDGIRWTQLAATGPSARAIPAFSADPSTGGVLLFGGMDRLNDADEPRQLGDTWLWNGTRWDSARVSGPPARDHAIAAADFVLRAVVMHGGASTPNGPLSDTWRWNGTTWAHIANGPKRAGHAMTMRGSHNTMTLFGGFDATGPSSLNEFCLMVPRGRCTTHLR